jgi:hypothetical protein
MAKEIKSTLFENKIQLEDKKPVNPAILGRFKGIISIADTVTQNGTYYPEDLWQSVVSNPKIKEKMEKRLICSELEHPAEPQSHLGRTCCVISDMFMEGKNVWGIFDIVNTPNGQILDVLLRAGVKPGLSTRALGEEEYYREGNYRKIKKEGFEFISCDVVSDPSNIGAEYKEMVESKKVYVTESLRKIKDPFAESLVKSIEKQDVENKIAVLKLENKSLNDLYNKEKETLKQLTESITKKEEEAKQLAESITKKESEIQQINENVNQKSQIVISKDKTINQLNETVKTKDQLIESKEKTIKQITETVNELKSRLTVMENEIKEKELLLNSKEEEVKKLSESKKQTNYTINIDKEAIKNNGKEVEESLAMRTAKHSAKIGK